MAGGFTSTPEARRHHIRQYGSLTANNGLGESPSSVNERKGLVTTVTPSTGEKLIHAKSIAKIVCEGFVGVGAKDINADIASVALWHRRYVDYSAEHCGPP